MMRSDEPGPGKDVLVNNGMQGGMVTTTAYHGRIIRSKPVENFLFGRLRNDN